MPATRSATLADISAWAALRKQMWPDEDVSELRTEAERFIAGDSAFLTAVFVAESGGSLLGFIELHLRPYAEGARFSPVPHVEGWFVEPNYRRKGVGRALMAAAEEWARANGYREMTSDTTLDYENSPAAHRNLGFEEVERLIAFHKNL